jgi:uncharacterized membrane protein required for colicin V production
MTPLLIAAAIIVALFALVGLREGVIRRLVEIVGALLTIVLTARFAARLTPAVTEATGWDEGPTLITAWVALIIVGLLLSRLLAIALSKAFRLTVMAWVDRLGGLVCGALFGLLVASVFVNVVAAVAGNDLSASLRGKPAGRFMLEAAPSIAHQARLLAGENFAELYERVRRDADKHLEEAGEEAKERAEEAAEAAGR